MRSKGLKGLLFFSWQKQNNFEFLCLLIEKTSHSKNRHNHSSPAHPPHSAPAKQNSTIHNIRVISVVRKLILLPECASTTLLCAQGLEEKRIYATNLLTTKQRSPKFDLGTLYRGGQRCRLALIGDPRTPLLAGLAAFFARLVGCELEVLAGKGSQRVVRRKSHVDY